jgi:acetyl esterase/lipase
MNAHAPPQGRASRRARVVNALCRRLLKPLTFEAFDVAKARCTVATVDRVLGGGFGVARSPADAGGMPAEWIASGDPAPGRTILYLHGGGFLFRMPRTHAGLVARLARLLRARALVPDYRLVPEHPLPAAHEDCFAAYRWLLGQGHDPARIVVIGDSAGGLLTLATLQRVRDAGLPRPACAVLFSPGSDLAGFMQLDARAIRDDPMVGPGLLELVRRIAIAPVDVHDPAISPCAGSLAGLPPLLIQVGSTEALLGQSLRAAELARASGTEVELEVWPEMPHVFQTVAWLPESRRALERVGAFVARHMPATDPAPADGRTL